MRPVVIASANGNRWKNGGSQTCVERGVAALEGVRTPSLVAKAVMEQTDHHLLAGEGAQAFARRQGFAIEADLNSEHSRAKWLEWKRRTDPEHYLDPAQRQWGTLHVSGLNANGDLCALTTTSGLAWKLPGRVADSPIIGAGLYVDDDAGAAGSTGRGEANLYALSSFSIVEQMRAGRSPKDAVIDALRRVKDRTRERRLLTSKGNPRFTLTFYALSKSGRFAAASMYVGHSFALCDENGARTLEAEGLLEGSPLD